MATLHQSSEPLDYESILAASPSSILILSPNSPIFTIVGVSDMYLKSSMTEREEILGRGIFEVFPDNPEDPLATGRSNLEASLQRVMKGRCSDSMAVQKYDIRRPQSKGGGYEERYWSPINVPVFNNQGNVINIIHRVEDVTEFIRLKKSQADESKKAKDLLALASEMEIEIYTRAQEIQEINKRLREANEKLGELDTLKTKFFSNISHEFRTPLTLMLGPLEDLLGDTVNPIQGNQKERIELIRRNCLRLQRLVNTLLDFSQVEAGRTNPRFKKIDIAQYTIDLAGVFRAAIEKAGLKFRVDCAFINEKVYLDEEMWEKIIFNLLSNALKFTMKGEIGIALRENEKEIELSVSDSGSGIPENELTNLFQRFHRIKGAISRTHEGSGIGLALVQEFVRLHGGSISVVSKAGNGTVFLVKIPKGRNHIPNEQIIEETSHVDQISDVFINETEQWLIDFENKKETPLFNTETNISPSDKKKSVILFVDDNADMRQYISRLLQTVGIWEVEMADNGLQALQKIEKRIPDLVVTDIMMPVMDGFEFLKELRNRKEIRHIPVIFLSARAGYESKIKGITESADDYLIKPFSSRELIARIRTNLELVYMRKKIIQQEEQALYEKKLSAKKDEYTLHLKSAYDEIEAKVKFRNMACLKKVNKLAQEIEAMKRNRM